MREWTHRKLPVRHLGTIDATSAALVLLAFLLVPITSREFPGTAPHSPGTASDGGQGGQLT